MHGEHEIVVEAAVTSVARQPIVDGAGRVVGYELLFRNGHRPVADIGDGLGCTAEVVERTLGAMGLDTVLAGLDGYLNCTAAFLHSGVHQVLNRRRFVLEVLECCELDDELRKPLATQRAALMLHLALSERPWETAYAQTAYLTGMLSLLHVIYGKAQDKFAQELPLEQTVRGALGARSGSLGELLTAAETFEAGSRPTRDQEKSRPGRTAH